MIRKLEVERFTLTCPCEKVDRDTKGIGNALQGLPARPRDDGSSSEAAQSGSLGGGLRHRYVVFLSFLLSSQAARTIKNCDGGVL